MHKTIIDLLRKKCIIKKEKDFQIVELVNINPYKNNIIKIFSKIKNKNYIIKRCKQKEIENLKLVSKLLVRNKIKNIKVLKPIGDIKNFFLFEDAGLPLNKKSLVSQKSLFEDVVHINNFFKKSGYLWGGLALRNIFYLNKEYTLIDFEKFFKVKNSNLSRRHLLFLRLNLIQSFEKKLVDRYINFLEEIYCFSNKIRKMDRVEKVGWKTLSSKNKDEFLSYFDELTVNAEKPLRKDTKPFEIGHIVDELVSAEISFLWTLLMHEKRMGGMENFKRLLNIASEIIEFKNKEKTKFHLACLIIALGNIKKYEEIIKKIEIAKRYHSAEKYDDILKSIIKAVCKLVDLDLKNLSVIARGSYGECVLTKESDLDFEVVGFKDGKIDPMISIENLVCEILAYLRINAEGTKGRPTEKDVAVNGESRDFFEIFELRLISGNKAAFLKYLKKYKKSVYKNKLWENKTEYEKKNRILSPKSVFEDARFLITKLALTNNKKIASPKVFEKIKICPKNVREELKFIIEDLIRIRNGKSKELGKYQLSAGALNQIKINHGLPICGLTINNEKKS